MPDCANLAGARRGERLLHISRVGAGGAKNALAAKIQTRYIELDDPAAVRAGRNQPAANAKLLKAPGQRVGSAIFSQTISTP